MIVKAMGIIDIVMATLLIFHSMIPKTTFFAVGFYLIVKGIAFFMTGDVVSILDCLAGIYAILMLLGLQWTVATALSAIYLYQKGLFSLL